MKTEKLLLLLMTTFTLIRLFEDVSGAQPRTWGSSVPDKIRNFGLRIPFIPSFIYLPIMRMSETIAFIGLKIASLVIIILIIIALSRKRKGLESKEDTDDEAEEPDYAAMWQAYAGLNQGLAYPELSPTRELDYYEQSYPMAQTGVTWNYGTKEQGLRKAPKRYRKKYNQPVYAEVPQSDYEEMVPVPEPPRPRKRRPVQKRPDNQRGQSYYPPKIEIGAVQNSPVLVSEPKMVRRPRPHTQYRKQPRPLPNPQPIQGFYPDKSEPDMIRISERPPAPTVPIRQPIKVYRKRKRPVQARPHGQGRPRPEMELGLQTHTQTIVQRPQLEEIPSSQTQTIHQEPLMEPVPQVHPQTIQQRPLMAPLPSTRMMTIRQRPQMKLVPQVGTQTTRQRPQMELTHQVETQITSQTPQMEQGPHVETQTTRQWPQMELVTHEETHNTRQRPQMELITHEETHNTRQRPQMELITHEETHNTRQRHQMELITNEETHNTRQRPQMELITHEETHNTRQWDQMELVPQVQMQAEPLHHTVPQRLGQQNIPIGPKDESVLQTSLTIYQTPSSESVSQTQPTKHPNSQRQTKPFLPTIDPKVLFKQAKADEQFRPQTLALHEVDQQPQSQPSSPAETEPKPVKVQIQVDTIPQLQEEGAQLQIQNEPDNVPQAYPTISDNESELKPFLRSAFENRLLRNSQSRSPEAISSEVEVANEELGGRQAPIEPIQEYPKVQPELRQSPSDNQYKRDNVERVETKPTGSNKNRSHPVYPSLIDMEVDFEQDFEQDYEETLKEVPEIDFPEEKYYQLGDDGLFSEIEFEDEEEPGEEGEVLDRDSKPQPSRRYKRNTPNEPTNRDRELEDAIDICTYKMLCEIGAEFRKPENHRNFVDEVFRIFDFTNLMYKLQFVRPTAVIYERAFQLGVSNGTPFCAETYDDCIIDTMKLRNNFTLSL